MDKKEAKYLFDRYLAGNCTPEELALIKRAYNKEIPDDIKEISEERYSEMKASMWNNLGLSDKTHITQFRSWSKIAVAATLLLISGTGLYFFIQNRDVKENGIVSVYANDVPAGTNKAILTLANGKTINLSSAKSGIIIKASQLTYSDGAVIENINSKGAEISMISTPRGGQYNIELPDGTKVTLNAASTLKFPSSFFGLVNRRVELAGEGYFQVAKDKIHPFIVKSGQQEVQVLGTQFNINSYPDEGSVKTTLLEGSVLVSLLTGTADNKKLKPGQQAQFFNEHLAITEVDTEAVLGWKNGDFIFNEDIKTIMRQISRWYDVEVKYQGQISDKEFVGTFSRSKNVNEILKALELTKLVHFKVEGRRITVMP